MAGSSQPRLGLLVHRQQRVLVGLEERLDAYAGILGVVPLGQRHLQLIGQILDDGIARRHKQLLQAQPVKARDSPGSAGTVPSAREHEESATCADPLRRRQARDPADHVRPNARSSSPASPGPAWGPPGG